MSLNDLDHDSTCQIMTPDKFMHNKISTGCGFCDKGLLYAKRDKVEVWASMQTDGYALVCHHEACIHFPEDAPGMDQIVGPTCRECRTKCSEECHEIPNAVEIKEDASAIFSRKSKGTEAA